ncbi:MAG: MinD/ParA family protein [Thermoanaerobacteraceae bacterium]|nr:MinD/ParA family protein [Thermoanaerobacteraceae bacterium]
MDQAARLRELVRGSSSGGLRSLAVASGKGGVGKTHIVVNLSLALARRQKRVMVLDADLGLANVDILLGLVPRWDLGQVVRGEKELREIVIEGPAGVRLIPGGSGVHELADMTNQQREGLIQGLSRVTAGTDFFLIDTSAGISRHVLSFAAAAGEAIIVTTPEPTALTDAYGLIKGLSRLGVKIHLLVNRALAAGDGREAAARLQATARRFLAVEISLLGIVPEDRAVGLAVREQRPLVLHYPSSPAARAIEEVAARLAGTPAPPVGGREGFWQRLSLLWGNRGRR